MGTLRQTRELGRGRRPKIREALASYTVVNLNSDFQKQVNISHIKEIKSTKLAGDPKVESEQTTLFQINDINTLKVEGKVVVEGIKKKKPKCVLNITF